MSEATPSPGSAEPAPVQRKCNDRSRSSSYAIYGGTGVVCVLLLVYILSVGPVYSYYLTHPGSIHTSSGEPATVYVAASYFYKPVIALAELLGIEPLLEKYIKYCEIRFFPSTATTTTAYPKGVPVKGNPSYVNSPYAPLAGHVDVTSCAPGSLVRCPYTGKIFEVP